MTKNNTTTQIDLMQQFADHFTEKNAEGIEALLAEDFSLFDPALKWLHGKKNVLDVLKKQFNDTQHVDYKVIHAFEDGETGILEFQITLDHLTLYGVDFIEFEDGKMKELRCYYNPPAPPERGKLEPFSMAALSVVPGSIYEHYKGNQYKVLSVGRNSETLEEVVIYQDLNGSQDVWSRPLSMFLENIELNGEAVPRFKQVF